MKLFAIYVGGEAPGANIELHDMRFVVAPSIDDTHEELRRQWWGTPASLHIDCWAQIDHADGHDVSLKPEDARLYYVNLGGYDHAHFTEQHKNVFVVANSVGEAMQRALATVSGWDMPHRDDMYEAEQAFALDDRLAGQRLYVHLIASGSDTPIAFTCDYRPIGKEDRA